MTGPLGTPARLETPLTASWDESSSAARFVAGFATSEPASVIANARSELALIRYGDLHLPVTVESGERGGTYVTSPHSAYVLYACDEIDLVGLTGAARMGAKLSLVALDQWLRALDINRTVHIDNWMLSTSLHGRWDGRGLPAIREAVVDAYPRHLPVIRNVEEWSCPELLLRLRADGWILLPARQVWVTDDLESVWKPRSHTKSDARAVRRSGLVVEELSAMRQADADRIAELYTQLYLGRYSTLNPAYTPAFVTLAFESGALRWRVARRADGVIMASAGMRVAGDVVTVPMLGYDTTRPQSEALYRIASWLSSDWAMARGFRHHGSAGASTFKTNRGARGVIEYMAVHAGHASPARRLGVKTFAKALEKTMVPALKKQGW